MSQEINKVFVRVVLIYLLFSFTLNEHLADGLDSHPARHVASESTAHPIGDDQHQTLLSQLKTAHLFGRLCAVRARPSLPRRQIKDQEVIFVPTPYTTDIGFCV